jgi:hypothetical protein
VHCKCIGKIHGRTYGTDAYKGKTGTLLSKWHTSAQLGAWLPWSSSAEKLDARDMLMQTLPTTQLQDAEALELCYSLAMEQSHGYPKGSVPIVPNLHKQRSW